MKTRGLQVRRINKLIAALKTGAAAKMFNMSEWIVRKEGSRTVTEALKGDGDCGTTACMAGMAAAIAPTFFKISLISDSSYDIACCSDNRITGTSAFARWLEIPEMDAEHFCDPTLEWWAGKDNDDIKHAIHLLENYRDGKEMPCPKN